MNPSTVDFPRHFAWLLGAVLFILAWRFARDTPVPFACYGALHASSIVFALRGPARPWRAVAFVGLAAAACALNYSSALALRSTLTVLGAGGPYALVGAAAGIGGLAYAALIRVFWLPQLPWRALGSIGALCLAGGVFALMSGRQVPLLGGWWLAVVWWLAFSGGLAWRALVKAVSVPAHFV